MSVQITVRLLCGGCDAEHETQRMTVTVQRGAEIIRDISQVVPDGWVVSDPYTGCCYCPKCWSEIIGGEEA